MKVALVKPPNLGNFARGTGSYFQRLLPELKKIPGLEVIEKEVTLPSFQGEKFDIVHYCYFDPFFLTLPLTLNSKTIVSVFDMTPFVFPSGFHRGLRGEFKWLIQKNSLKRADRVITISKCSKNDIIKYAGIEESRIAVVYLAAGEGFKRVSDPKTLENIKKKYHLPEKFLLYVGDVNFNKNLSTLIKAFSLFRASPAGSDYSLVLVGKSITDDGLAETRELWALSSTLNVDKWIVRPGYVSDDDLAAIYSLAGVYVHPALYEGFGLTVLEAMSCGCPVICGDNSSLGEITAGKVNYADVSSEVSLKDKMIESVTMRREKRIFVSEAEIKQASNFSWLKTAHETAAIYEKTLGGV